MVAVPHESLRTLGERQQELLRYGDGRGPGNEKQAVEYPAHLHIDLLPVVQGGGVGRRLIATLLDELRRRGVRGVHLGVDPQNVGAAAFYERLGFERLPSPEGSVRYGIRIAPVDDERQAQATAGRTDAASLLIHTDQARVFDALTREDALLAWLPPRGMHGRFERFDMREGGSFRLVLTYDDASAAPGKSTDDSDVSETRISALVAGSGSFTRSSSSQTIPRYAEPCAWSGPCAVQTAARLSRSWHATCRPVFEHEIMPKDSHPHCRTSPPTSSRDLRRS